MQHYSIELYIPTPRLGALLRDLSQFSRSGGMTDLILPDGERVRIPGDLEKEVTLKAGSDSPWIGLVLLFPPDPALLAYDLDDNAEQKASGHPPNPRPHGLVEVGHIYLWIVPQQLWTEVQFIACVRSMDRLFEQSPSVHRTFLGLHDRHGGVGAFLNRGDTPPCTCVPLDNVQGAPIGSPSDYAEDDGPQFDVDRWLATRRQ